MTVQTYAPGTFCWHELGTTDIDRALEFYPKLFDWTVESNEMPGGAGTYYKMLHGGGEVCGMYSLNGPMFEGVPTHWIPYVWTDDTDASAKKAEELGATVYVPPMDVPGVGRMAFFRDPAGANLALFQGTDHCGAAQHPMGTANIFCWDELATRTPAESKSFYTSVFGWGVRESTDGMAYSEWTQGEETRGGMLEMTPEMGEAPPHWLSYLAVDDCDASVAKATELGANVLVPAIDIPHVGRFSVLMDPTGGVFAVIKLALDVEKHQQKG